MKLTESQCHQTLHFIFVKAIPETFFLHTQAREKSILRCRRSIQLNLPALLNKAPNRIGQNQWTSTEIIQQVNANYFPFNRKTGIHFFQNFTFHIPLIFILETQLCIGRKTFQQKRIGMQSVEMFGKILYRLIISTVFYFESAGDIYKFTGTTIVKTDNRESVRHCFGNHHSRAFMRREQKHIGLPV